MGEFFKYRRGLSSFEKVAILLLIPPTFIFLSTIFKMPYLYLVSMVPYIFLPLYINFYIGLFISLISGYLLESIVSHPSGLLVLSYTFCFVFSDIMKGYMNVGNLRVWIYTFTFIYIIIFFLSLLLESVISAKIGGGVVYFIEEYVFSIFLIGVLFYTLGIRDESYSSI